MSRITIGDYCKFGNNLVIVDHDHNFRDHNTNGCSSEAAEFVTGEIVIGNGVWIGADCVILKGVTIGDNAVVGAGSIVRRDIPAGVRYYEKRESMITEVI
jgi:acetyltransferase-like isoleucine patch superfamily enzyme